MLKEMYDFLLNTVDAARELLGWRLIHETPEGIIGGTIVETEAYTATDAASHSFKGRTARNSPMFAKPGTAYIYFTYGMHYCLNVVTAAEGQGEAVLIRALEPIIGIGLMQKNRGKNDLHELTNGPAKLVQALGVTKAQNGCDLLGKGELRLLPPDKPQKINIVQTTRIGIRQAAEKPWRFYIADNPYISRP